MRLVLPTPLSPIIITFAMKSYFYFFLAYSINTLTIIIYYNQHPEGNFDLQMELIPLQDTHIKQTQSRITNANPELSEDKLKYAPFPSPNDYQLNQSLFNMKQLLSQQGYSIIFGKTFLYFGGTYKVMKHGLGVLLTEDTVYQGQFSLDFKTGKGYQKFPNGSIYFGDFQNNRTHGQGSLKFGEQYYVGDFENGSMQGDGLWKNSSGDKYIGEWKSNKAHGHGVFITSVSHYQGYFSKFVKQGDGIEHFKNGDIYKGMYENGVPHGYGQYNWKDGTFYAGDFVRGQRQGQGKWRNSKRDEYEGDFKNDKKMGLGVFKWTNGNVYKGQFKNDMRQGDGEMFWGDGSHYKGQWKNGVPHGLGTFKITGEKPKTGIYQNNVLVKEIKPHEEYNTKKRQKDESLILAMIPQVTKKRNFVSRTYRSRDTKSKMTNDTSMLGWQSFHR